MTDRLLLIHWNELSLPEELTAADLGANPRWKQMAESAFNGFFEAVRVRPDCRISFSKGTFHGQIAGRSLLSWLEMWLGKDKLRKLKGRAVQPEKSVLPPIHVLECELSCNGRWGEGVTRAHIAETWTWSLGCEEFGAAEDTIQAVKSTIDSDASANVAVANVASIPHVNRWEHDLQVWGQVLSSNHVIAQLDRYLITMYPLDHGYAHVHVHAQDDGSVNAKYRVDVFEPLTKLRPVGLDGLIEPWVARNRTQLLHSWTRCKAGGFPLKLNA